MIVYLYVSHDCRCKAVSGDNVKSTRTVMLVQNSDACKLIVLIIFLVKVTVS